MELIIDDDVKAVLEFMQGSMAAAKLVSVAAAVSALAPILWARYAADEIAALSLRAPGLTQASAEGCPPMH